MIRSGVILGIVFFFTVALEMSFLHALAAPIASIPLVLLVGILLLHTSVEEGILWMILAVFFTSTGFLSGSWIAYFLSGAAGIILVRYLFSRRSVFGLLALGFCLLSFFFLLHHFLHQPASLFLLLLSEGVLFFLFSIWQYARRFFGSFLFLRGL